MPQDMMIDGGGPYALTGLGVAHPWLCDVMGHLTTRHYLGFFDDATWQILADLGYRASLAAREGWGWADVHNEIAYVAEVPPGSLLRIASRVTALGTRSLTIHGIMQNREDDAIVARFTGKLVCFDLVARKARLLPDTICDAAASRFGVLRCP